MLLYYMTFCFKTVRPSSLCNVLCHEVILKKLLKATIFGVADFTPVLLSLLVCHIKRFSLHLSPLYLASLFWLMKILDTTQKDKMSLKYVGVHLLIKVLNCIGIYHLQSIRLGPFLHLNMPVFLTVCQLTYLHV